MNEISMIKDILKNRYNKEIDNASSIEIYSVLLEYCNMKSNNKIEGKKKLYYISSEFLIGKMLSNNLINLNIYDEVRDELLVNGHDIKDIEELENEPSLGNGGLGRLAACFIDSVACLGLNGDGIGLLYHFGLFKQVFENNQQVEYKDSWIDDSWLVKTDNVFEVRFKGFSVNSVMYEMNIIGYTGMTNKLKLFDIETVDENIITDHINFNKKDIQKNLTLFLYPDDSDYDGNLLRIYQQYFMVSSAAQLIIKEALKKGSDLYDLKDYVVIQINDTHPSLIIVELIYILINNGIKFDDATKIVHDIVAYTNHTILSEALEKWPINYLKEVVPHLVVIIDRLNAIVNTKYKNKKLNIIDEYGNVHMAHLDIHYGFSINGVAKLHTQILKDNVLNHFYKIYPNKFSNKTNGITHRRWLFYINPKLCKLIESEIGDGFKKNALELKNLLNSIEDSNFLNQMSDIKRENKHNLALFIKDRKNIVIDEDSIFDIQVKRLHEYKRQQMNALYIIDKIIEIRNGIYPKNKITFIFGAKAAPAYKIAQDIIHLILVLETIVENDSLLSEYIKVVMVENYNIDIAQRLIPACDISEQISLASKEASGTGNMKFMLNGAITLGTLDGANVEIAELVKEDNIYIFGKKADEIISLYESNQYNPELLYYDPKIRPLVDFIISDEVLNKGDYSSLMRLYNEIVHKDWYMTLIDLKEYIIVKNKMIEDYSNNLKWKKMQLTNIAMSGYFSSDRTIKQYQDEIWKLEQ